MQKTKLYDACLKAGGKMVDFHGWMLPVQFDSILEEHKAVREYAGVFDVSHMGQIFIEGKEAYKFLQTASTNNFKNIPFSGAYSHILNDEGGIIDDIIAFCLTPTKFLAVVNSATRHKDYAWLKQKAQDFDVKITDASDDFSMLALQGPASLDILENLDADIKSLPRFNIKEHSLFGAPCYITRTGYTGEDGVEIMGTHEAIIKLYAWALENGFKPCGLGARDILRLEAGYLLSGSDMDETKTPYEASCGWVIKLSKEENFFGRAKMEKQKAEGVKIKWKGIKLLGPGIAREGCAIYKDGKEIGRLTSAVFSPLYKCIGAGYVPAEIEDGAAVEVEIRGRRVPAQTVKMPFYKNENLSKK